MEAYGTERKEKRTIMSTFFSVDVETSGLTPHTGYLLTVGIQPVQWDGTQWELTPRPFYVRIERGGELQQCKDWKPGISTYDWWHEQADDVRAEAWEDESLVRHHALVAARMVAEYVTELESLAEARVFVANPVAFDKMWLTELFGETGIDDPFHYRSLCLRSMKFGMRPCTPWGGDRKEHKPKQPHHALSDATAQALDLVSMMTERDGANDAAIAYDH